MNDWINEQFPFSFVIEEYMHLDHMLCSPREQSYWFVELAALETLKAHLLCTAEFQMQMSVTRGKKHAKGKKKLT